MQARIPFCTSQFFCFLGGGGGGGILTLFFCSHVFRHLLPVIINEVSQRDFDYLALSLTTQKVAVTGSCVSLVI